MDALADVLRTTSLSGGVYLRAEFAEPWCLQGGQTLPDGVAPYIGDAAEIIQYHFVLDGLLRVKADGVPPLEIAAGEAVLFPRNTSHRLGGDLSLPPRPSAEVITQPGANTPMYTINMGGTGTRTRIVCGYLAGERLSANPLIRTLPPVLRIDVRESGSADWFRSTFDYAADQIASGRMGSGSVLAKVSELLLVEAVRSYAESVPAGQSGWLGALKDPYVSHALGLMHGRLGERWTVARLARELGLSRSALAQRFGDLIGLPPMQYLAQWRMEVAAQELRRGTKTILRIAQDVGYDSEAAFSRAFKRVIGTPPATWRRQGVDRTA